jgi:hypothetical protein
MLTAAEVNNSLGPLAGRNCAYERGEALNFMNFLNRHAHPDGGRHGHGG